MSQITQEVTSIEQDAQSFFNSPAFHDHIRTWMFVILSLFIMGGIYVHESNANAAKNALADQIVKQGQAQQASLDKQIQALHEDTTQQVKQIQQQIQSVETVSQAIAALKSAVPPINIQPLVTQPAVAATDVTPAKAAVTTADTKAAGSLPMATITGDDLKTLADNALTCKAQAVELNSCKQQVSLEEQKAEALQTEVDSLKKVKLEPAWKKTITTIGHIIFGIAIGKAL